MLAHRGVAQTFKMEGINGDTCTAEHIHKPEHDFLENTIPSMEAAFSGVIWTNKIQNIAPKDKTDH